MSAIVGARTAAPAGSAPEQGPCPHVHADMVLSAKSVLKTIGNSIFPCMRVGGNDERRNPEQPSADSLE